MAHRTCLACGKSLEGTRQRKYCANNGVCKMRYHRGARAEPEDGPPDGPPDGIQSTEAATMLALAEAGRLGTPLGQTALVLARRIDRSHMDTGAGVASLAKQLAATLSDATAKAKADDDPLDELRARRDSKRSAAS